MNIRTCIHSLQCQSNFIVKNSKIWASAATWNKMLLPVIVNWPSLCLSNNFLDDVFQIFVKYFLVRKERLIDLWKNSCFIKKIWPRDGWEQDRGGAALAPGVDMGVRLLDHRHPHHHLQHGSHVRHWQEQIPSFLFSLCHHCHGSQVGLQSKLKRLTSCHKRSMIEPESMVTQWLSLSSNC